MTKRHAIWLGVAALCVSCGIGCASASLQSGEDDRGAERIVIGIHGLRPKPEAEALGAEWHRALLQGLSLHTQSTPDSIPFRMVRWVRRVSSEPQPCPELTLRGDARVHRAFVTQLGVASYALGQMIDRRFPQAEDLSDKPLAALAELLPWDQLQTELREYYSDSLLKRETRDSLANVLRRNQDKDIMLIAHSMGSMIAYDVLQEDPQLRVDHLVTVGSPLGLSPVREAMKREWDRDTLEVPRGVVRWTNFADRLDIVAVDQSLDSFEPNGSGVTPDDLQVAAWVPRDLRPETRITEIPSIIVNIVDRFRAAFTTAVTHLDLVRHHSICGYLSNARMAEALSQFLDVTP